MCLREMIEAAFASGHSPEAAARLARHMRVSLFWSWPVIVDRIRVVFPNLTEEEIADVLDCAE